MQKLVFKSAFVALILGASALSPALAHEAPCPVCSVNLTQDTPTQDNETVLKFGRKRIEYKCVYCALSEAQSEYKGDLTILAPSEKKGEPIKIVRQDNAWSAPEGTVFAAQKGSHHVCQVLYRAFSNQAAFEAWVKAHPKQFDANVKAVDLKQMLALSAQS